MEVNEYLLAHKEDDKDDHTPPSVGKSAAHSADSLAT